MQSRISSLAQVSHHGFSGKGILGREHSRCSEWDYPYKVDMDYRDKIWGRSDLHKRTGISYDPATTPSTHKDGEPRREQEGTGGSGDSTGGSSYHIRSYQEWRQGDRMASSHGSANGYLKESTTRVQGLSDVLGSWHSPLSSPVNYIVDGGRDDGSQMSPRKRPRLGWGQGLAKYEKKITGGADDSLGTKGRGISCPEEVSSCIESPHQGTGQVQTVSLAKAVSDGISNPCSEADKDIHAMQMEQKTEAPGIDNIIEKNKEFGSMPASEIGRLESCQSLDTPIESKELESTETPLQVEPQGMVLDQCSSLSTWSKSNILQRLEKLELDLDFTEKELAKFEVHSEDHLSFENDCKISDTRDSEAVQVRHLPHTIEHKEGEGEVLHASEEGVQENEEMDEQRERPFSGICETSLCEVAAASDSKMHTSSEAWHPSCYSLHTALVTSKEDDGPVEANQCNLQGSGLNERSLSAASFSELDRTTGVNHSSINSESFLMNGEVQLGSIYGALSKEDNNKCWRDLYDQNKEQAKCASQALASLLPDSKFEAGMVSFGKCKQVQSEEDSTEGKLKIKQQLEDMLLQKKMSHTFMELVLALKYRALRETWKREQAGICQWNDRTEGLKKLDIERKNGTQVLSQRTSHRLRLSVSGIAKVDAVSDELQTIQKLLAEPFGGYQRPHLKMPSQILDEKERNKQRFLSNNALIEDPVAFEQERKTINPWTPEEKKIFLENFFSSNKNFQKIASLIEHKTVADCIEFYYRNQKSEEFEMMRRRQQLKNRRDYSRPFSYLANTTPPNSRRREVSTICVDKLPIPSTTTLCNEDGRAFFRDLSKNVQSSHIASIDSNSLENPPVNSGSVSGRNITTEESDKLKTVENSQSPRSIIEEFDSQWTDDERQLFVIALGMFGKDFKNISQHVATKSEGQCKAFFSKTRKRLGLDQVLETFEMNTHENLVQAEGHREGLNSGASVEHLKCVEIEHVLTDNDDANGDSVFHCLPLYSAAGLGAVSLKSTEEPSTMFISSGNGEEIQNMKDERPVAASVPEITDCLRENREEMVPSNDMEGQTEGMEQNGPVALPDTLSTVTPKEEKIDPLGILTDPSSEPGTEVVHVSDATLQQEAHRDEKLSNTISSKTVEENEAQVSATRVNTLEKPVVEEMDLQADSTNHTLQDCPDVTQTSHSSSSQTYLEPVVSNISTVTCTTQPRSKGNPNGGESKPRREATSWTQDEKEKFVEIYKKHGRDWSLLQENLPSKSLTQIKTYFQNSKAKLGLTATEGIQSRSAPNRKPKMDDSDSMNGSYRVAHHKAAQLSEEVGLKSDQTVNGGSDGLPFAFYAKGGWQAEDHTLFNVLQQMCPNGYTQQSAVSNGQFPVLQSSVIMGSGFHQPQNNSMQQSLSLSASNSQPINPQQTQQIAGLPQLQSSSASCDLQSQILNQIKQQQIASQVHPHSQQDYQTQSIQKLQLIMQQQAVQSFQQNISTSVLQQQQSPQPQVIHHQQNQQQHLTQSPHLIQHAMNKNLHYLQQQSSIQSLGQLAAVASQQLSSNHLKVINQQQLPNQQQLMNQFQLHYDDQQNKYHSLQSSHVSQQEQHSILGSLQEQLARQLLYHQHQLQSEKQPEPLRMILPIRTNEISEVSHHHQGQAPDIISGKEQKQWQDLHNCQSIMLHKGANQSTINDSTNLHDSIEMKNVLMSQSHETGHLLESQVNLQVRASPQLKPGSTSESHQTRAGDVKLFGQFLLSQPASSLNSTASASEGGYSKPMFSLSSTPVSHVEACISEGLPYTYPDGTPCLPSGFGRIGLSFSQSQCHNLPGQSTSAVNPGLRNNLLDGREHACLAQATESGNDTQSSQTSFTHAIQRFLCEGKEFNNAHLEGASPFLKFDVGEQSKRVLDGQIPVMGFGPKRQGDQGNSLVPSSVDLTATNSDLRSNVPCISSIDIANLMVRRKDVDLSAAMGAISSQTLRDVEVKYLASTRRQGSRDLRYAGGHSSEELHRSRDSPGNNVCHAVSASKSIVTNTHTQMAPLGQSFAVGVETSKITRDNSFLGQQGILYGSGSGGLVPTVSSVWPHGPVIVEGQSRADDSKSAEENKRQPT
ncbi:uncharacterized protein LOC131039563 isoform X2 [Cryptomeria japonica]|nr:uncharacterized protein LOC131039563 isoform X2 [Cryptomeria japonica]